MGILDAMLPSRQATAKFPLAGNPAKQDQEAAPNRENVMDKENFQMVCKANRLLSHNQGHKIRVEGIHGTLTSFWVEKGKLFGNFSYKNSGATHAGMRLEMSQMHRVNLRLLNYVIKHFEDHGILID